MSTQLITLETAKTHLRIINSDHDPDIETKINLASAILMDALKLDDTPDEWDDSSSPPVTIVPDWAQAMTLLILGELWLNRESSNANVISNGLMRLIHMHRDPTQA